MSFINDALKKAQQEKDSRYAGYGSLITSPNPVPGKKAGKMKWAATAVLAALACGAGLFALLQYQTGTEVPENKAAVPAEAAARTPLPPAPQPAAPAQDQPAPVQPPALDVKAAYREALGLQLENGNAQAEGLYRKIIASDPHHTDALNNLGVIVMAGGNRQEAISLFDKVIALKPDSADAHYNLACIYAKLEDSKSALEHLEKAVAINPELRKWASRDKDLQNLWALPKFKKIISRG